MRDNASEAHSVCGGVYAQGLLTPDVTPVAGLLGVRREDTVGASLATVTKDTLGIIRSR